MIDLLDIGIGVFVALLILGAIGAALFASPAEEPTPEPERPDPRIWAPDWEDV